MTSPWQLFDRTPIGCMLLERSGTILRVNRAWRTSMGLDEAEAVGRAIDELVSTEGFSFVDLVRRFAERGYVESLPLKLRRKDGTEIEVLLNADLTPEAIPCTYVDVTERTRLERSQATAIQELEAALTEVKTLRGLLPICAGCRKIRDEAGAWKPIERYISERTGAEFSHGICPECVTVLYPDADR